MANNRIVTNCVGVILGALLSLLGSTVVHAGNTSHFIDSEQGSDKADGRSEATAWRTLDRANQVTFEPGDRLLFKSGGRWSGQLRLKGSGTEGEPIHVGRYEKGEAPPWLSALGSIISYKNPPHYSSFFIIDRDTNIKLTGSPDGVLVKADNSHVIVDYKTAKFTPAQDELLPNDCRWLLGS